MKCSLKARLSSHIFLMQSNDSFFCFAMENMVSWSRIRNETEKEMSLWHIVASSRSGTFMGTTGNS